MSTPSNLIVPERIERRILFVRGQKVLLDFQLADLYEVETRSLNQAVRRNLERFPSDFMFQLTEDEALSIMRSQIAIPSQPAEAHPLKSAKSPSDMRSQTVIASGKRNVRFRPYAFTEQGVAMLSSVLGSARAIAVNIEIMRTFVRVRALAATHSELAKRLAELEDKTEALAMSHDTFSHNTRAQLKKVFDALRELMTQPDPPKRPIGFINPEDKGKKTQARRRG